MKIAVVGPESTGKTQLCKRLAHYYGGHWVPEYARYYLATRNHQYQAEDLIQMAGGQLFWRELYSTCFPSGYLFFDTALITYCIWSQWKYHYTPSFIEKNFENEHFDLVLLTYPDLPWTYDPQRENPDDREALFERHLKILTERNTNFHVVSGFQHYRILNAIQIIEKEKKNLHI